MRRKAKLYSKSRDETEDVVQIIHSFEDNHKISTKSAVIDKLMELKKINKETANENVECSLCLGAIVILYNNNEKILKDTLRLKEQRHLIIKSYMDCNSIVLQTLKECGAKNKKMSCLISDIEKHILLTYNVETSLQNVSLSNLIKKAIYSLLKKDVILQTLDSENNQFRYYFPHDFLEEEKNDLTNKHKGILTFYDENLPSTSYYHEKPQDSSMEVDDKFQRRSSTSKKKERTKSIDTLQNGSAKGELKQLQDSLSQFFTPSNIRRLNSFNLENKITKDYLIEQEDHVKSTKKALEIVIDESLPKTRGSVTSSSDGSFRSPILNSTTPSPHRRHDQLHDALSSYFSVNSNERRRKHEKGKYFIMNSGTTPRRKLDSLSNAEKKNLSVDYLDETDKFLKDKLTLNDDLPQTSSPTEQLLKTPSLKLGNNKKRFNLRNSNSIGQIRKETRRSLVGEKANKLLKRACDRAIVRQNLITSPTGSPIKKKIIISPYKSKSNAKRQNEPASFTKLKKNSSSIGNRCLSSPIKSVKNNAFKASSLSTLNSQESAWNIPDEDCQLFDQAREIAQKHLYEYNKLLVKDPEKQAYPARVRIGNFEIKSWYSSPYPQEYIGLPILYICESCLTYLSEQHPHIVKCKVKFPPGNEIYRNNNISIFEIDGNLARVYCRNLCLLAKLFIDHKTLYFDVEPFLFYVMTINDNQGVHFVGYFSKEKFSSQKYNLACIVTLPCYQGKGYGRFLIDFSYLLTRKENMLGSPERPLSDLGRIAYHSYWKSAIFEYLFNAIIVNLKESISINDISQATGITHQDVLETFVNNNMIHNACDLVINVTQIKKHWDKVNNSCSRIWINEDKLKWIPKVYSPSKEFNSNAKLASPQKNGIENSISKNNSFDKKTKNNKSAKRSLDVLDLNINNKEQKTKTNNFGRKRAQKPLIESLELNVEDAAFLSEDEDDEITFRQTKTISCNTKVEKKFNRKTPSTDGDVSFTKKNGSKLDVKHRNSYRKTTKSRKNSRTTNKNSKEFDNNNENMNTNNLILTEKPDKKDTKTTLKNKISLTSESEDNLHVVSNDDDSTSEYEIPKKKFASQNFKKKVVKSPVKRLRKIGKRKSKKNKRFIKKFSANNKKKSQKNSDNNAFECRENIENQDLNKKFSNSIVKCDKLDIEFDKNKKRERRNSSSNNFSSTSNQNSSEDEKKTKKKLSFYFIKNNDLLRNINSKKRALNYYGRHHHQLYDSSDDNIDEACCSSSTSPQPLGDRLPIIQTSNQEPETINMGGEPDTINMGGEPDQDGPIVPVQNVFSPKAPLAPLLNNEGNAEDDEIPESETYKNEKMICINEPLITNQQVPISKTFDQIYSHNNFNFQTQNNDCNNLPCISNQISQPFVVNSMYNNCELSIQQRIENFVNNMEDNNQHKISLSINANLTPHQSYYSLPQNSLNNKTIDLPLNYLNTNESEKFNIIEEKISDKNLSSKNRNADMPVLDSLSSIPSNHIEDVVSKETENDDDEAPPQLSPNMPSHEPLSPNNDQKILEDSGIQTPVKSRSSIVNTNVISSKESVTKRHVESGLSNVSGVNMPYESIISDNSQISNSNSNLLKNQDNMLIQQSQNLSKNYDFNQCQLDLSKFTQNVAEYSNIDASMSRFTNSASIPTVNAQSTNVIPPNSNSLIGTYENDYKQQLFSPNMRNQMANPMSAGTTAIVNHSPNQQTTPGAPTRNDVISPQNSSMPTLLPSQQPTVSDYNNYHNNSLASSSAIKRSNNEHQQHLMYNNQINSTFLTPNLTIADQTPRLNLVENTNKKNKKLSKEKSSKSNKRTKASENNRSQSANAQANIPCILPTSSSLSFMNPAWTTMTDYNPMQQAMMAAQFMSASSQSMNFHQNAAQYYPQPNYFNAASIANNYTQHQYPAMSTNSLYNNPAAWSHYCANYSNLGYPALRNNASNSQPTLSSTSNVDTSNAPVTTSWPMVMNPAFSNLINNNSINTNEAINNTALNPLNAVNGNSFYPPVAYQNLNLHQLYSSYSAHT